MKLLGCNLRISVIGIELQSFVIIFVYTFLWKVTFWILGCPSVTMGVFSLLRQEGNEKVSQWEESLLSWKNEALPSYICSNASLYSRNSCWFYRPFLFNAGSLIQKFEFRDSRVLAQVLIRFCAPPPVGTPQNLSYYMINIE